MLSCVLTCAFWQVAFSGVSALGLETTVPSSVRPSSGLLESVHAWFDLSCIDLMHCWALEWAGMLLPETGRCCQCHSPSIAASRRLFCAGVLASTNIELHSSDTAAWCMQIQQRWPLQSGVDASTRWCSAAPSQALWSDQPSTLGPMLSSGAGEFLSPWRLSQAVCCSWGKSSALPKLLAPVWSHPL